MQCMHSASGQKRHATLQKGATGLQTDMINGGGLDIGAGFGDRHPLIGFDSKQISRHSSNNIGLKPWQPVISCMIRKQGMGFLPGPTNRTQQAQVGRSHIIHGPIGTNPVSLQSLPFLESPGRHR